MASQEETGRAPLGRFSYGCDEEEVLRAGLLQSAGCVQPRAAACGRSLACWAGWNVNFGFSLFSISGSKSPIFNGRLRRRYAHFSCHILYPVVSVGKLYGNNIFKS